MLKLEEVAKTYRTTEVETRALDRRNQRFGAEHVVMLDKELFAARPFRGSRLTVGHFEIDEAAGFQERCNRPQ